jgi:hypothetical protein
MVTLLELETIVACFRSEKIIRKNITWVSKMSLGQGRGEPLDQQQWPSEALSTCFRAKQCGTGDRNWRALDPDGQGGSRILVVCVSHDTRCSMPWVPGVPCNVALRYWQKRIDRERNILNVGSEILYYIVVEYRIVIKYYTSAHVSPGK